jgi:hypothetical protein
LLSSTMAWFSVDGRGYFIGENSLQKKIRKGLKKLHKYLPFCLVNYLSFRIFTPWIQHRNWN